MSAAEEDPRIVIAKRYLIQRQDDHSAIPDDLLEEFAVDMLGELDAESPNSTIRRLQEDLVAAWNGEASDWELERASQIVTEIGILRVVQSEIVDRYPSMSLSGMDHPLWAKAEARIVALGDELEDLS